MRVKSCSRPSKCSKRRTSLIIGRPGPCWIRRSTGLDAFAPRMRIHCRSAAPRIVGSIDLAVFRTLFSTVVRTLEHFTIWPSPGSQDGEPSGEEPPGVRGSLDGHLPWETALHEPSRLIQTGSRPTSHRGGHWFDPSIAHRCKARSEASRTTLILLCGWELSSYWEPFGRSFSTPGRPGAARDSATASRSGSPAGTARSGARRLLSNGTGSADECRREVVPGA